ncbi:hypothetical protein PNEG_03026 [Pneumocystis murina B123]|uniref:Uncharacterized protein n=1 Tax=Pneumocystis murina (strain B123) TaxID=1069680 RepID=M7P3V4_PNEMU|nr:hypothetical protein PNEG_03026 [Pneumocystis murina B123]EMR08545.1 hypothetical protein PNEG_03026 [Pneumocystis murina B123]
MRSEKAVLYERLLDTALCSHDWSNVPELVRKVRKHDEKKDALCEIVLAEYRLESLMKSEKNEKIEDKILCTVFVDARNMFSVVDEVSISEIMEIVMKFLNSVETQHEKLHARTVLSHIYFLKSDYRRALETISSYCEVTSILESSGYCLFNIIKGYFIKGLCQECMFETSLAIETYKSAVYAIEQIKHNRIPEKAFEWLDFIYYRSCLLFLRSDSYNAIKSGYLDNSISLIKKALYSAAVCRLYYRLLSELLNNSILSDTPKDESSNLKESDLPYCVFSVSELESRILKIEPIYKSLLLQVVNFPKSGRLNGIILEYVDWVMKNWKNMGKGLDYAETIVETIYHAINKTYKSHRLIRYLMEVLIFLRNYDEARCAFDLYVELVERAKISPFRQEIMSRRNEPIEQDTGQDFDDDITVAETYVNGIKLYIIHYDDFEKALAIVKKLRHALDTLESPKHCKVIGDIWEVIGITYSCQSIKTYEASERPSIQQDAINAFQKSLEYVPDKKSTLYHLAFQYAEQREITDAILTIKNVVSQKYMLYQSFHLLSLLLSTRGEYSQAIQICEAAIQISGVETGDNFSHLDYRDRESLVEIKITLCALLEARDGIDVAIEMYKNIFNFYAKVFKTEYSFPVFELSDSIPMETISSLLLTENKVMIKSLEERLSSHVFSQRYTSSQLSLFNASKRSVSFCSLNSNIQDINSKLKHKYSSLDHSDLNVSRISQLSLENGSQSKILSFKQSEFSHYYLKKEQKKISKRCLRKIWLVFSSLYCRASKWDESLMSIKEAEKIGLFHPDVHTQWGIFYYHLNRLEDAARRFEWALLEDHDHINANIGLSKVFLDLKGEKYESYRDRAEQMLDMVTKLSGWDSSEAWLLLGESWEKMNDLKNAKKAYWYAVELEDTRPVRHWRNVSPRFVA